MNHGRPYQAQVKPYNFMLVASRDPLSIDPGAGPLVAPFTSDPAEWMKSTWYERSTGKPVAVTVKLGQVGDADHPKVCVQTLSEYYRRYKSVIPTKFRRPPNDEPGLLQLRPVRRASLTQIGKESNAVEAETDAGLIDFKPSDQGFWPLQETEDADAKWIDRLRPVLADLPASRRSELCERLGVDPSTIRRWIAGTAQPVERFRSRMEAACVNFAEDMLKRLWLPVSEHPANSPELYSDLQPI